MKPALFPWPDIPPLPDLTPEQIREIPPERLRPLADDPVIRALLEEADVSGIYYQSGESE